jgi:Raf kinase inhibitor-like YbhB/YbcL family protein
MRWLLGISGTLVLFFGTVAQARDVGALTVTSTAFTQGGMIPREYTCEGRSVSPPLSWSTVPSDTKSIAVIVDDPDAPNGTFDHLVLFNLPPSEHSLASIGTSPHATNGLAARNSNGATGFAAICPPTGQHRYRFQVMALDTTLPQSAGVSSTDISNAIRGHVVARGELTGVYQKGTR